MKNKKRSRKFGSRSGFSLVEVSVAFAIFSTLILISIESFWKAEQALKIENETMTRIRVFQGLINIIGMPSTLRASAYSAGAATSPLGQCVFGLTGTCPNPSTLRDLTLLLPSLTVAGSGVQLSGLISRGPSAPILYNLEGVGCDPLIDSSCLAAQYPIAVSTQWEVVCPPKCDMTYQWPHVPWVASDGTDHVNPEGLSIPNVCRRAHYIKIHYKFEPATPGQYNFSTETGTLMVSGPAAMFSY